jgi:hypothetical protein
MSTASGRSWHILSASPYREIRTNSTTKNKRRRDRLAIPDDPNSPNYPNTDRTGLSIPCPFLSPERKEGV